MSDYPGRTSETKQFLDEKSVEAEYDLRGPWLKKRRRLGLPPKFYRLGRMIRYHRREIEDFMQDCVVEPRGGGRLK